MQHHYTTSVSHIEECTYTQGRWTPQSTTDACNTTTPNKVSHIAECTHIQGRCPPIEHRCLEYHYTKLGRCTGRSNPHQLIIDALNTVTPNLADLSPQSSIDALNTITPNLAMYWQIYPPSIEHRCLEYHYTKLGRSTPHQLSIDALNTITPNLADLPPSIEHRCLQYCYTKLGRSTPPLLSIDH